MAAPVLVVLSGGLDSTTLLHHVARDVDHGGLHAISFNYGQRHARELECAAWQANAVAASHVVVDCSFLGGMLSGATVLSAQGDAVPELDDIPEEDRDQPPTYVPNRNMILLSIAAAYAEAQGIRDVYYGAQAVDEYGYWDCTRDFVERLNNTFALNRREANTVHALFLDKKKADLLRMGKELGVDYSHTWSCYRGGEKACGVCPTCAERLAAFKEIGEADPLPYENSEKKE